LVHAPPTAISGLGRQLASAGSWSSGNKTSTGCCISTASLNAAIVRYFCPPCAGEGETGVVAGADASSLGVSSSESGSPAAPRTTGRRPDNCVGGGGGGWSSSSSSSSSSIFSSSFSPCYSTSISIPGQISKTHIIEPLSWPTVRRTILVVRAVVTFCYPSALCVNHSEIGIRRGPHAQPRHSRATP